jgi:glucose/arabinose dehydrogenase
VTRPVALMGAHAAAMGVKFYTGKMFPAEYQNTMFIARKGSWNRTKPNGFDVVNMREGEGGKLTMRPFLTGFNEEKESYKFWGRPAYIAQMPDGALLVSDEQVGAIYRISYQRPAKAAAKKKG